MKMNVKDLKGSGVQVIFGPICNPEKFEIDLLEVAHQRFAVNTIDFNELELEIGDRLGERPYPHTGRAIMPRTYLCEGSVWLNFYDPEGRCANVSLVPHFDETGHIHSIHPHHNFWLYWTDFDGRIGFDNRIPGHMIQKDETIVISIMCGKEVRKGTIAVRP